LVSQTVTQTLTTTTSTLSGDNSLLLASIAVIAIVVVCALFALKLLRGKPKLRNPEMTDNENYEAGPTSTDNSLLK